MKRFVLILALMLFPAGAAWGQTTGQITGTVTGAAGAPLSGVAIVVTGTGRGADTQADGTYTITGVPAGQHEVKANRIGYGETTNQVTVTAGQTTTLNIQMTAQALSLEGVVAVGYGTMQKRDVTGAVASVSASQITKIPTPNLGEALKGRAPGLSIQSSSFKPGDSPDIRIRGVRSLTAGNSPLVVVDGVPIAGGIEDINPQTIQSVDILKDASSTAVYGSRGANGVILVTTNRGRAGATRITYDTYYGTEQIHTKVRTFTGPEYAQFRREALRADGKYGCPEGVTQCEAGDVKAFSTEELANVKAGVSTDWMDLISRNGAIQSHQLSISGGSETTQFAASGNYLDDQGVTKGMGYLRRGASVSVNHADGNFTMGISANVTNSLQNIGQGDGLWGDAIQESPVALAYDEDGNVLGHNTPWDAQMWNPLANIENWKHDDLRTRTFGNAFLAYDLMDGLNLKTTFGADLLFRRNGEFRGAGTQPNQGGSNDAHIDRYQTFNYVSTTQLQLDRDLSENQHLGATLLYELQKQTDDRSGLDVINLPYEYQLYYNVGTAGQVSGVNSNYSEWLLQSGMGRVNYTYLDRYYLTLTGREDCSSRLSPGNKCTFFPSAAAKWRLSDEAFMQNQNLFSDLSLRASWGRTGNTSISPYQTQGSLAGTEYAFGSEGALGFRPDNLANPNLSWEQTDQYDVAVDFGLWNQRVSGTIDGYIANTHDLLMERKIPSTTGYSSTLQNVGKTRNTGIEVALSTLNLIDWHGLSWNTDLTWTKNKNEIVKLFGTGDDVGNEWFIGEPIDVNYQYEFQGIWQADEAEEAASYGRQVGDIRVVDQNGDGKISADGDRVIIGNTYDFPDWIGSLSNSFTYGAFDLSALVTARWGYMLSSDIWPGQMSSRYNQVYLNYWTPENPSNEYPRPHRDSEGAIDAEAVQLKDASNWRIRNITLGYTVPNSLTSRLTQNASLRIYAQAQDPWVFTDFKGFDPERANAGSPSYRTLLLGATVGF